AQSPLRHLQPSDRTSGDRLDDLARSLLRGRGLVLLRLADERLGMIEREQVRQLAARLYGDCAASGGRR
ncbi:MAG TPA: hypothetical protein VNH17_03015, partial [Streptosporangiaceae bacterium]|nr:hypothetical protein [Streptosporangiaceae bacterium]